MIAAMANDAVVMQGIVKRFPLVLANNHVDFSLRWGEVHALIGENGAGKSTLMKILDGIQAPDEGSIRIDGQEVVLHSAKDAIDAGIGMVHQHFMLVEPLSVTENLVLGAEPGTPLGLNYRVARAKARQLIEQFGFDIHPDSKIRDLPLGLQQQVEILKVLYRDARILILDEPTAVLTPQETKGLFSFIRSFAEAGNAVIFISHKLDEVMELCDRMSVMRDGSMIGCVERANTDQRQLATMMVGREVLMRVEKTPAQAGEVKLELQQLSVHDPIKHKPLVDAIAMQVRAGEIVGLAGIEGNGQSELVEAITGLRAINAGSVWLNGHDVSKHSALERRQSGLSHIPADRNARGLVSSYNAAMNSVLGDYQRPPYSNRWGFLNQRAIYQHARQLISAYNVRPTSAEAIAASYSGGNAQKLIVAREIERQPSVLIAAQPTRGVDIGAIEFIHKQIIQARDQGLAVLLVSADLNEVMSLADRILVMYEGRIMGELSQAEANAETLGLLMAGSSLENSQVAEPVAQAWQDVNADAAAQ